MRKDIEKWIRNLVSHCVGKADLESAEVQIRRGRLTEGGFSELFADTVRKQVDKMESHKLGEICNLALGEDHTPDAGEFFVVTPWQKMRPEAISPVFSGRKCMRTIATATILALAYDHLKQGAYRAQEAKADRSYALK